MALGGLIGLGVCIRRAMALRRGAGDEARAAAALRRIILINTVSVGVAFFGLALLFAGLLLG